LYESGTDADQFLLSSLKKFLYGKLSKGLHHKRQLFRKWTVHILEINNLLAL
jgi:hypothetical protein